MDIAYHSLPVPLRLKQALLVAAFVVLMGSAVVYVVLRGRYNDIGFWFVVALAACVVVICAALNARWESGDRDRGGFEVIFHDKDKD